METIHLTGKIDSDGHLRIDVSTTLSEGFIEVLLSLFPQKSEATRIKKYDFSDLAGKLNWDGDVLGEQNRIRNEWI